MAEKNKTESILILQDIRSVINIGAMFRTADAVGVSRIILSGYSPAPIDRFGRIRNDFAKASLGAEHSVAWEQCADVFLVIQKLKEKGYKIIAVEQDKNSVDYKSVESAEKIAIVMGTETTGIAPELLAVCDVICEIPMRGSKESLNV